MTALKPATHPEQIVFCRVLILDLSVVPVLRCWAALSAGTDTDEERDRILVFALRLMRKIFALNQTRWWWWGGETELINPRWEGSDAPGYHCSAMYICRYEATITAKLI